MNAKITAAETAALLGITLQGVHKQLKVNSLAYEKSQNRVYFGYETAKSLFKIPFKQKIVAIQIVKGGTGKTSLTHSIAIRANLYGAKVLCIDLDQQGNLTQAFQINPEETPVMIDVLKENIDIKDAIINFSPGLDIIPSRIENAVLDSTIMIGRYALDRVYKDKLAPLKQHYDLIILDCPPALGQSVAAATLASDVIIAPVTPEKFCLSGLKITSQELNSLENNFNKKIPMRVVLNKFDSRTSLSHEVLSTLIKHPIYGENIYKSYIRASQEFPNAIAKGQSIFDSLKNTIAKEDVDLLTREILEIKEPSTNRVEISLGSLEEAAP
jgi:chromosome partitioning protein